MRSLRVFRPVTWLVAFTFFSAFLVASPSQAAAAQAGAQLTINGGGSVRVDGASAVTGATIFSGSRITTASGATAVITSAGSRVTLNTDTDAIVTYAGGFVRADVICGSASGAPAPGATFDMITHGDTNVFVSTGTVKVQAEGKTVDLVTNQNQTFQGGVRVTSSGPASFEASTMLCSCLCAAPATFPVVAAAFPLALLLLLIGGGAAAATVITTTTTGGGGGTVVVSDTTPG